MTRWSGSRKPADLPRITDPSPHEQLTGELGYALTAVDCNPDGFGAAYRSETGKLHPGQQVKRHVLLEDPLFAWLHAEDVALAPVGRHSEPDRVRHPRRLRSAKSELGYGLARDLVHVAGDHSGFDDIHRRVERRLDRIERLQHGVLRLAYQHRSHHGGVVTAAAASRLQEHRVAGAQLTVAPGRMADRSALPRGDERDDRRPFAARSDHRTEQLGRDVVLAGIAAHGVNAGAHPGFGR